jgi:hypothetical protein
MRCFRRFRKIVKSDYLFHHVCLFVYPSVRMEKLRFQCTDFHEMLHLSIFETLSGKFMFLYNLTRIMVTLHKYLCILSSWRFLTMRNISENCRENGNTYFMFSDFFHENPKFMTCCGRILYCRAGHRRQYSNNTVHSLYELDK